MDAGSVPERDVEYSILPADRSTPRTLSDTAQTHAYASPPGMHTVATH
eukprot:COSAG05_NODE_27732_length_145_cov_21.000000_1_plen_47_part_11